MTQLVFLDLSKRSLENFKVLPDASDTQERISSHD